MSGETGAATGRGEGAPPVADDDFPEFAEPPRHRPPVESDARDERGSDQEAGDAQDEVDDVIARLRRERAECKR